MKIYLIVIFLVGTFIVGCSGSLRDSVLEAEVSKLVETSKLVAVHNGGQILVNIESKKIFEMEQQARKALAEKIAQAAINIHPEANTFLVVFGRVKPEIQQVSYSWKNEKGNLVQITQ